MSEIFNDRKDAGLKLADELKKLSLLNPLILALPRGGVSLGAEVARVLRAELDIVIVRKLGAPFDRELAIGAIVEGARVQSSLNEDLVKVLKVEASYIEEEQKRQLAEIERQHQLYRQGRNRRSWTGRTIIIVDDGIATGASIQAALKAIKQETPEQLILATPVAPPEIIEKLTSEVERVVCLMTPADFVAVGQYYRHFREVTDEDVQQMLGVS